MDRYEWVSRFRRIQYWNANAKVIIKNRAIYSYTGYQILLLPPPILSPRHEMVIVYDFSRCRAGYSCCNQHWCGMMQLGLGSVHTYMCIFSVNEVINAPNNDWRHFLPEWEWRKWVDCSSIWKTPPAATATDKQLCKIAGVCSFMQKLILHF